MDNNNNNHQPTAHRLPRLRGEYPQCVILTHPYLPRVGRRSSSTRAKLQTSEKNYQELLEDFREKSRRYENDKKANEELKKQLENTRQTLQTSEENNRKLQTELTEKSQQYEQEKEKIKRLKEELVISEQKYQKKSQRYDNGIKENETLKKKLEKCKRDLEKCKRDLENVQLCNRFFQKKITDKYEKEKNENERLHIKLAKSLELLTNIKQLNSYLDKKIVVTTTNDGEAHAGIFLGVFGDSLVMSQSTVTKTTMKPKIQKMNFNLSSITSIKKYFEQ